MEKEGTPTPSDGALPILEHHTAPEIFASALLRADMDAADVMKLTFVSNHYGATKGAVTHVVNLRLVMSKHMVEDMLSYLQNWLKNTAITTAPKPEGAIMQ